MSEKKITHYHMDKMVKYLFLIAFLSSATVLGYHYNTRSGCNEVLFVTNAENYAVGEAIQFNDDTLGSETWQWSFGDNETSTQKNPAHYYEKPGEYNVELIVNGNCVGKQIVEVKEAIKLLDSTKFPVFDLQKTNS